MKLEVPYYSQFIDIQDSFWMIRACGGLCLKMVAEYHLPVGTPNREGVIVPDILSLCNEAKDRGGYDIQNGWVHDYIVSKAQEFGLKAHRKEGLKDINEITTFLDAGSPVIVSVEKRVLEQTRFHMIVVVGYDNENIIYHESESTDKEKGQYRKCSKEIFMNYWRGKAIFISK